MNDEELLNIDLEQSSGYLLMRCASLWQRAFSQTIESLDLTSSQYVLLSLTQHLKSQLDYVTQAAIAQHSGLDAMTLSQVARRLEQKGYLLRQPHPQDNRAKYLSLTEQGQQALLVGRRKIYSVAQEFFDNSQEPEELNRLLSQLFENNFNGAEKDCLPCFDLK